MSFILDVPTTEDMLATIFSSSLPPIPPQEQSYASTHVSWWETDPGEVYIHAEGGTADDRHYASTLTAIQLEAHGYKRAQFDVDEPRRDYYHMAPTEERARIQQHGLQPSKPVRNDRWWEPGYDDETGESLPEEPPYWLQKQPEGVYVMNDPARARELWGYDQLTQPDRGDQAWDTWRIPGAQISEFQKDPHVDPHGRVIPHVVYPELFEGGPETYGPWPQRDDQHLGSRRISAWPDIMAKAKRLIQSGQVQVLRNGYNYIMGHVIGDHGEYDTELSRDDPSSRAITGWQCSCPWDQYAWQRTRKWKKFEGRPCAHVMALYWKALSTPLDEQLSPEQAEAMGTGQKLPGAPPVAEHPPEIEDRIMKGERPPPEGPRTFGPEGPIQGEQLQMNMPPEALGGPPGPAQAPLTPPPGPQGPAPPGVLPPFPGEQMQMQWAGPGTTPGGGVSPPGAVSVPGAKPQTFMNPLQQPGTYSKVGEAAEFWLRVLRNQYAEGSISLEEYEQKVADYLRYQNAMGQEIDWDQVHLAAEFNPPEIVRLKNDVKGLAEGPVQGQYGDGEYRDVPAGSTGEVRSVDQVGSQTWVEVIFPLDDSGYHEPFHVRVFVDASDIEPTQQTPPGPFIRRRT